MSAAQIDVRGELASKLTCWHRLTGVESDELVALFEAHKTKVAQEVEPVARDALLGAIARGWCSPKNSHKEMDSDLALAILDEFAKRFTAPQAVNAELLEALRVITLACCIDDQNGDLGPHVDGSVLDMANAAIKKAEGAKP